jgi:hypothetical protein
MPVISDRMLFSGLAATALEIARWNRMHRTGPSAATKSGACATFASRKKLQKIKTRNGKTDRLEKRQQERVPPENRPGVNERG